jgi:predicted nucleotidyltransferase
MKHYLSFPEREIVIETISTYLIKHYEEIASAYVHGSFITGESFTDIDIAIITKIELDRPLNFELDLEIKLERIVKYQLDVRIINNAPLSFCQNVIRYGKVIVEREPNQRADFEGLILRQYFDFSPFRRLYLDEVINAPV